MSDWRLVDARLQVKMREIARVLMCYSQPESSWSLPDLW